MSKELVIGSNRHETKVAILEEDQLVEVYFQRGNEYSLAGSIHKGRVTRVLPGMQSAFVDLGLERDTFLYVSDFFEENEDIDTVEEKPVAAEQLDGRERGRSDRDRGDRGRNDRDRNDRDRGDRGPARMGGRPPQPERGVERLGERRDAAVPPEVQPLDDPAGEEERGSSNVEVSAAPEVSEPRPMERSDNRDRGGRNRRSRRRRPRTQGFPENKYAQSPGAAPVSTAAEPALSSELEEEEEAADVMILPGESLAKYRQSSPPPSLSSLAESSVPAPSHTVPVAVSSIHEEATEEHDDLTPFSPAEEDPDEQEAIAEEADSLELADKIFSHHDAESVEEVEEKIEEVKQDQPASSSLVRDEAPENTDLAEGSPEPVDVSPMVIPTDSHSARLSEPPQVSHEFGTELPHGELIDTELPHGELIDTDLPHAELIELDEFEIIELDESVAGFGAEELGATEGQEHLPEGGSAEAAGAEGAGQTQSATVREQGGRYMHRASRRMRRRRGGNRFGQSSDSPTTGVSSSSSAPVTSALAGAGAAAAFQPEVVTREPQEQRSTERPERVMPSIADLLKAGQEIIVQIAKEPLGQKGARITSHVALPGRYVVFMPGVSHVGVSRKIASDEERLRLKRILQTHRVGTTGGFIVRTAGEGVPEEEIAADMNFLYTLWLDIRQKAEKRPAPALLHYDLDIVQRILRDQVTDEFKAIWVDNEEMYESVLTFIQRFQPALVGRVKMYTRAAPIFDAFNITQELEKALRPKVWLKSGGYIVINQTEALVAIDINTGKYVGKSNRLEDTIVKTNTEAVKEIVRQIRLRDLGGIIVVDFIDMDERKNRQKVMQTLEEAMRADKAPYKILQFNDFGLVAITRKRVKQSLERTLCSPCPYCEGAGYVKSVQTVIGEILIEGQKIARAIEGKDVMLRVHPEVAKVLKARDNRYLEELEEVLGRPVLVTADAALHQEKFDLA